MIIIPAGHRVLVKPLNLDEVDEVVASAKRYGIELPKQTARQEAQAIDRGIVVLLGMNAFKDFGGEAWCNVGDEVVFAKYGGKVVDDHLVLNDEDIIAILKKDSND